jgi:hypothetical protein
VAHEKTLFPISRENLSAFENAIFHARIQVHKVSDSIVTTVTTTKHQTSLVSKMPSSHQMQDRRQCQNAFYP